MPPKRKDLSKFAKSLLDDQAKESSQLGRELEDELDGEFDEEMVSPLSFHAKSLVIVLLFHNCDITISIVYSLTVSIITSNLLENLTLNGSCMLLFFSTTIN